MISPCKTRRSAFSLIEVMAAITVLAIIMFIIGGAYSSVNNAWNSSTSESDMNSGGRAVLSFMARELSSALVSDRYQLKVENNSSSDDYSDYSTKNDRIYFNTMTNRPRKTGSQDHRSVQEVLYYAAETTSNDITKKVGFKYLKAMRAVNFDTNKMSAYGGSGSIDKTLSPGTNQGSKPILSFIRSFKVRLYCLDRSSPTSPKVVEMKSGYDSNKDYPKLVPVYVDLFLEVLGHDHARTASMSGSDAKKFTEVNADKFSTRVYFQNISGTVQDAL